MLAQAFKHGLDENREEGREKGKEDSIVSYLAARFGTIDPALAQRLRRVSDPARFDDLIAYSADCTSPDDFARFLDKSDFPIHQG